MSNGINVVGDGTYKLVGTIGDDTFAGTKFPELYLTGMGNDVVFAGAGHDEVFADLGDDWLDGSDGIDTISFSDLNYLDLSTRRSNDHAITLDLNKTSPQNLGYLGTKSIFGFENVMGSYAGDKIYGTSGANELFGLSGDDLLKGRGGNDILVGDAGRDTLVGGAGADMLYGTYPGEVAGIDAARDVFVYKRVSDSGVTPETSDTIWGYFSGKTRDKIDLSAIDANGRASGNGTFKFIGSGNFHANSKGEVQVTAIGIENLYAVRIDVDRDKDFEMSILVNSTTALTANDFIL